MTKYCKTCKQEKPIEEFRKDLRPECKKCLAEYNRVYRETHKEQIKEYSHQVYLKKKDKMYLYTKNYRKLNRKKVTDHASAYHKKKRESDPLFKLKVYMTARTSKAFRKLSLNKPARTNDLLGTDYEIIKKHIEQQFKENMTWNNYGEWHIDHIIPLASAKDMDELIALCHYSNLQPLWATENRIKGCRIQKPSGSQG